MTNPDKASHEVVVEKDFETSRNGTAETHQIISIESKTRQPNNVLVSSSGDSATNFIELPENPYLKPNFTHENINHIQTNLTAKDNMMKQ